MCDKICHECKMVVIKVSANGNQHLLDRLIDISPLSLPHLVFHTCPFCPLLLTLGAVFDHCVLVRRC